MKVSCVHCYQYGAFTEHIVCKSFVLLAKLVFLPKFCFLAITFEPKMLESQSKALKQWLPTIEKFLPREEFHEFRGGIFTL